MGDSVSVIGKGGLKLIKNALALGATVGLVIGCAGSTPPTPVPATSAPPTAAVTAAATMPTTADPTPMPPARPTATPSAPASVLEGTWSTGQTTCEQQNAAVEAAGFSADEMDRAGWDPENCSNLMHGTEMEVRFAGDRLFVFQDGNPGWNGVYEIVDDATFEAGDSGSFYIRYAFALDGDVLTVDMLEDNYPTSSEDELLGETLAQTVIYESAPFTRQDP